MSFEIDNSYTSLSHSGKTGALLGLAETYVNHPLWVIKTRLQCGYPFTLNLRVLYRGAGAEALVMVPVDVIQMIVSNSLKERIFQDSNRQFWQAPYVAGFIGGAVGGIGINGIESFMLQQQKRNQDFLLTFRQIKKERKFNLISIGVRETMVRNGIYNAGFFALAPTIDQYVQKYIKESNLSILTSGALSGVIVSYLSHPLDMIKTIRQEEDGVHSIKQTMRKIYNERGGVRGFWIGVIPRSFRVITGISVMSWVYQKMQQANH